MSQGRQLLAKLLFTRDFAKLDPIWLEIVYNDDTDAENLGP